MNTLYSSAGLNAYHPGMVFVKMRSAAIAAPPIAMGGNAARQYNRCLGRHIFARITSFITPIQQPHSTNIMAMLFEPDFVFLQRFLRTGGFYKGDIDGIIGPKSRTALAEFEVDSKPIADEFGVFDKRTESRIASILLPTQRMARKFMKDIASAGVTAGLEVRIISGTRTYAEQNVLFA